MYLRLRDESPVMSGRAAGTGMITPGFVLSLDFRSFPALFFVGCLSEPIADSFESLPDFQVVSSRNFHHEDHKGHEDFVLHLRNALPADNLDIIPGIGLSPPINQGRFNRYVGEP
jgi:hypothetical protein